MRFAKNTQHDTSKVLRLPRKMAMDTSKVLRLPRKLQHIFWKRRKSIAPATQNDFRHVPEHVWMSRSATPATRNEATTRLKRPKMTTSAELTIGTAIWSSRGRLRTVADGCGRLRTVADADATSSEHTPTPRPPEWNGNPCYAFGKKQTDKTNDSGPIGFSVATSAGHSVSNWRNLKTKNGTMPRNETLRFTICCWPAPYTRDPVEWARWNPTIERKSQERLGKNNNQLKILGRGCDH